MRIITWLLTGGMCLGMLRSAWAQLATTASSPTADSSRHKAALAAARRPYEQATKAESRLLSGTEYVDRVRPGSQGHPFFESAIAQLSTVEYDGQLFRNTPLLYDVLHDQVVVSLPDRDARLQLLAEKVQSFTVSDHYFVRRITTDTLSRQSLHTGFYELLLHGGTKGVSLLARYAKHEAQEPTGGHLTFVLEQTKHLYLQKGTAYWEVNNLRDLQRLLPEQKSALQNFAHNQRLRFKNNSQTAAAVRLLRYYNTLLP